MADLSMYEMNSGGSLVRKKQISRSFPSVHSYLVGGDTLYLIEGNHYSGVSGQVWKLNTAAEQRWECLPELTIKNGRCSDCVHGWRYAGDYCELYKQDIPKWYSGNECKDYQ
ncbi:MAG: hypothetical protein E6Q85_06190 [Thiothrix sp.]|nr:MAG: hypothetical protein E6Q85_06190 [Thiothrix sp.]